MQKPTSIEFYLDEIDSMAGASGTYHLITAQSERPPIWSIAYKEVPDRGHITGFTYGLSSVNRSEWKLGRPELLISVKSTDLAWVLAIGFVVKRFRSTCPFSYGNVVRFGGPISTESLMTAFFMFAPSVIEQDEAQIVADSFTIHLVQAYPIYEEEIRLLEKIGASSFFLDSDIDFSDVRRRNSGCDTGVAAQ